jgi:hypothetical protein
VIAPLLLAAALAGPAAPVPRQDVPAGCALTVRFGSYAMGIDRPAAARIEAFLAGRADVAAAERHSWGREGEYDLCVRLRPGASAVSLFEALRPLVQGKTNGPVEVRMTDRGYGVAPAEVVN